MNAFLKLCFLFFILSCTATPPCSKSQNEFLNCVSCENEKYKNWTDFDYSTKSMELDKLLILQGVLPSCNRVDFIELFTNNLHLKIQHKDYIKNTDDTFMGSPIFWSNYLKCSSVNEDNYMIKFTSFLQDEFKELKTSGSTSRVKLLGLLTDKQFNDPNVKIVFHTFINEDIVLESLKPK